MNLSHADCVKLYTARNNAIRVAFGVPRATHRYLIKESIPCPCQAFTEIHQIRLNSAEVKLDQFRYFSQLSSANLPTSYIQKIKNIADHINIAIVA